MVMATRELIMVITSTPRKLKMAAMMMASCARIQRVDTQVAIALGASVQPFTKITPNVNTTVMASIGLESICAIKSENDMVIWPPLGHIRLL